MLKNKRNMPQEAALVFTVLLVFTPVIVWAHGDVLNVNDALRIVLAPILWMFIPDITEWCQKKWQALKSNIRFRRLRQRRWK